LAVSAVIQFIYENYGVSAISKLVFMRLASVYDGTFPGLNVEIPATDLIDMWRRRANYLNKIANQNATKGKVMEGNARILYDISVLVNQYDSYLKWKREQQILSQEKNVPAQQTQKINFDLIERQGKAQESAASTKDEIDSILDEIF
jgi:hypothetical protein